MAVNTSTIGQLPVRTVPLSTDLLEIQAASGLSYSITTADLGAFLATNLLSNLTIDVAKDWQTFKITNLGDPTLAQDAATKAYVDAQVIPTLAALTDVTITTRAASEVLVVNIGNTAWVNAFLVDANIDAAANIDATKLGTGVITNTEFNFLNGVGSQLAGISDTAIFTNKTLDSFLNSNHADTEHMEAQNESGVTITKGTVVYISGYDAPSDLPLILPADASASGTMPAVGIVTTDIADTASGDVTLSGILVGVVTTGFTAGDTLYVSETAGAYTIVRPTDGALVQNIGTVLKVAGVGAGRIKVTSMDRVNALPNLSDGDMWIGDANALPVGVTMSGNATISNTGVLSIATDAITTVRIINDAVTLAKMASGTAGNLITYDASGNPVAVATGTATQVLTSNGVGVAPTFQAVPSSGVLTINADGTAAQVIAGTASRISLVDAGATHTLDIDAAYVGQASITTLGTITTGVWTGTAITGANLNAASTDLTDTASIAYLNTANTYIAGDRQDFLGLLAGTSGMNVGGIAGNPTTQVDGDIWYNSTSNTMFGRINGTNIDLGAAGAGAPPFADTTSIIEGSADPTKELRFEVDGFTTATVRVITPPDADITLVNTSDGLIVDAQTGIYTTTKISTLSKSLLNASLVYTDQTNTFGDFAQIFRDNQLKINNPTDAAAFTISAPGIAANRTITLPLLLANDIFVTEAFAQTLTNKVMTAAANTFSGFAIGTEVTGASTDLTDTAVIARSTNNLSFFAATTSAQLLGVISDETGTGLLVFGTSPTIVTPTIASFANATHDHSNAAGGGNLTNTALTAGTFASITGLGAQAIALAMGTNLITGIKGTQFVQNTITYNATQIFDLDGNEKNQITLTGVLSTLTTSNRAAGKSKQIFIVGDSSDRLLTFNTSWKTNPNTATVNIVANTFGVLSLYCRGTAETDVFAVYAEFS